MAFYGIWPRQHDVAPTTPCCIRPAPIITYDDTPTAAYTFTLNTEMSAYFNAYIVARELMGNESATWSISVHVKRGVLNAEIQGDVFQESSRRTNQSLDVDWVVGSGNVYLMVKGLPATTIKWQTQIHREEVIW